MFVAIDAPLKVSQRNFYFCYSNFFLTKCNFIIQGISQLKILSVKMIFFNIKKNKICPKSNQEISLMTKAFHWEIFIYNYDFPYYNYNFYYYLNLIKVI